MKKLSIGFLISIVALMFCFSGVAYAQEGDGLPDPGITPDSPFYFMDKWAKQLILAFTFKHQAKAQKALQYAEERLAEVDAMLAKKKYKEATQARSEYQYCLAVATKSMERVKAKDTDTSEMVALAVSRHVELLNEGIANASENASMVLTQTRENARKCQETALRVMVQGDPEKAVQTKLILMERQLNRVRVMVDEQQETRLQQELQEYERLGKLDEEIAQIAGELGKGTTVDHLIGQATSSHLAILAEVHERVQEQSWQVVEEAMRVCVEKHERGVAELSEQNRLGQIPEEPPIPEEVSENVRQRISSGEPSQK